jgi:hypothetical protein
MQNLKSHFFLVVENSSEHVILILKKIWRLMSAKLTIIIDMLTLKEFKIHTKASIRPKTFQVGGRGGCRIFETTEYVRHL